jgi:hypothetical protein
MQELQAPPATASAYVNTEIARLMLGDEESRDFASTRSALAEAAYYLSDPMEPDDRARLLSTAEQIGEERRAGVEDDGAIDALGLLSDAADEVERLLRGPGANSEIRIARKAVSRAVAELARQLGIATELSPDCLRSGRLAALRRRRTPQ